jgi:LAS superfamily LD-carboxypeptidase LdcB
MTRFTFTPTLLLMLLSLNPTPQAAEWVVLPELAHPYLSPSSRSTTTTLSLHYPQILSDVSTAQPAVMPGQPKETSAWIGFVHEGARVFLPAALAVQKTSLPPAGQPDLKIGQEVVDITTPLPLDYKPHDLVKLAQKWNNDGADMPKQMRTEAAQAVERMLAAAEQAGIRIRVASSFRSADKQRDLYLKKIRRSGLDQKLVAKPGHSEHQLGTVVDLCGANRKAVLVAEFGQTPEGRWLRENATRFGFRQSYTVENAAQTGYEPEPWHFRYMGKSAVGK